MKIIVAIPCFNCEKQIPRVIKGFNKKLLSELDEVMVINNRSEDNTVEAAKKAIQQIGSRKFSIYTNTENYNLGGTHKVAFLHAEQKNADYIIILHGDDQASTQDISKLIRAAKNSPNASAVLGSRFSKGSELQGYSIERIIGNKCLNLIYSIVTLRNTRDLGSGLNIFKIDSLKDHRYLGFGDNLAFNFDLLLDFYRKKSILVSTPIIWRETDQVSNAKNLKIAKMALTKLARWRFHKERFLKKTTNDYTTTKVWSK